MGIPPRKAIEPVPGLHGNRLPQFANAQREITAHHRPVLFQAIRWGNLLATYHLMKPE